MHKAAKRPRPDAEKRMEEDAFANVYEFLVENTSKDAAWKILSGKKGRTFELDGVKYAIGVDVVNGENVFSVEWTSDKKKG